jgi:hypothetical protein
LTKKICSLFVFFSNTSKGHFAINPSGDWTRLITGYEALLEVEARCKSPDVTYKIKNHHAFFVLAEPQPTPKLLNKDSATMRNTLKYYNIYIRNINSLIASSSVFGLFYGHANWLI